MPSAVYRGCKALNQSFVFVPVIIYGSKIKACTEWRRILKPPWLATFEFLDYVMIHSSCLFHVTCFIIYWVTFNVRFSG